jgi:hypothetical protein
MWLTATLLSGICVASLAAEPSTLLKGSVLDAKGSLGSGLAIEQHQRRGA